MSDDREHTFDEFLKDLRLEPPGLRTHLLIWEWSRLTGIVLDNDPFMLLKSMIDGFSDDIASRAATGSAGEQHDQ